MFSGPVPSGRTAFSDAGRGERDDPCRLSARQLPRRRTGAAKLCQQDSDRGADRGDSQHRQDGAEAPPQSQQAPPTAEPRMLPKRPMPSIQLTPVARATVG